MNSLRSAVDFACVAMPKILGGLCLVLLNISLMNWLGTATYGVYALCLAALSLLSEGLIGAAIDMGVIRLVPLVLGSDPIRAIQIERVALRLKMQVAGGLSLVLIVASLPLSQFLFHRAGDFSLIVVTCVAALGMLVLSSALLHFQIRGHFFRYGLLDSIQNIVKFGGISLVLFYVSSRHQPLALGEILIWFAVAPLVACGFFMATTGKSLRLIPSETNTRSRSELLGFVKWFLCTFLVTSLISKLDIFLLTTYCSIEEVGLFAAGQTIATIPVLLGAYLSIVFSPQIMPACRAGSFLGLLCRVQTLLFVGSFVGYAVIYWNRDFVTRHLLPESFAPSSTVILILLPATLFGMTSFPLAVSFLMFIRPRFLVTLDLILLPFLLIAYVLFVPPNGAVGAAFVAAGFGMVKTIVAQLEAFRLARKSPEEMGLFPMPSESTEL